MCMPNACGGYGKAEGPGKGVESVFTLCEFGGPNSNPLQEQQWLLTRELSLNHWLQCHINYIPLKVIKGNHRKER